MVRGLSLRYRIGANQRSLVLRRMVRDQILCLTLAEDHPRSTPGRIVQEPGRLLDLKLEPCPAPTGAGYSLGESLPRYPSGESQQKCNYSLRIYLGGKITTA